MSDNQQFTMKFSLIGKYDEKEQFSLNTPISHDLAVKLVSIVTEELAKKAKENHKKMVKRKKEKNENT